VPPAVATHDAMRQWRINILVSTWLSYVGFYFCRKAFYVVKGPLAQELGLDTQALGEIGAAYLVAYTLGQFASAALGTRYGPRVLLLGGMAASVACNVAFGTANGYWTLFTFMVVNGLGQATGWPCAVGTLAQWTRRDERGTLMGLWSTCYQLGGAMASSWAAFWLARQGWRGSFFAASLVLLAIWFIVLLYQRNRPEDVGLPPVTDGAAEPPAGGVAPDANASRETGWTAPLVVTVLFVGAFYFGVKFIRYALWSWAPYFLQRNYGLAGDDAGYLSIVFDVAGFLGVITAGVVSDRLFGGRRAKVAFLMLIGMTAGCALLYTLGSLGVFWFAVSLGVVGFMLYGPDSLLTGAGAIDVGSRRTALAAAGIINGMGSIGSVVQELFVSRAYQANAGQVAPVFAMLLAASATSLACLACVLWRNRRGLSDL
jgi:OPA family sugar phosphate sensor protein UhpC-like MFS transporter